jgi:hypothetical protein
VGVDAGGGSVHGCAAGRDEPSHGVGAAFSQAELEVLGVVPGVQQSDLRVLRDACMSQPLHDDKGGGTAAEGGHGVLVPLPLHVRGRDTSGGSAPSSSNSGSM